MVRIPPDLIVGNEHSVVDILFVVVWDTEDTEGTAGVEEDGQDRTDEKNCSTGIDTTFCLFRSRDREICIAMVIL